MSSMTQIIQNAFLHRKSFVTDSSLYATEPYQAVPIILSHESLWIDSESIPDEIPALVAANNEVDLTNDLSFFDSFGNLISIDQEANRISCVQKKVRIALTRGDFGEYFSVDQDLRRLIHENFASGFSPVIEYTDDLNVSPAILPRHLWNIQYMSGIITVNENILPSNVFITAYFYTGRVGLDKKIKNPSTDDIEEGVINKFFTKDLMLSHINELAIDSNTGTSFVLSVGSSDSIIEGVQNKFFTQENFDRAFQAKTLTDLSQDDSVRFVTAETMSNLNLSIGGVSELAFSELPAPPGDTNAKLYVERNPEGGNVLFFEETPISSLVPNDENNSRHPDSPANQFGDQLGNFVGTFDGPTKGVHMGDVRGNVQGFVSDLGNHPIIEAKVLGNGEGHWVGTVNGDIVGKFEGYAKVVTGSVDNASHLTVGTFDATASVHVKAEDNHLKISHTDGSGALIQVKQDSHLLISCSRLQTTSTIICNNIDCSQTLNVNELNTSNLRCAGLTNSFYGIFETGRIEDVTEIVADVATLSVASVNLVVAEQISSHASFVEEGIFSNISCNSSTFETMNANKLSVSDFHVQNLSFDASLFLENPNLVFNTLSVSAVTTNEISAGNVNLQNILVQAGADFQNITSQIVNSQKIITTSLSCSVLHIPSGNIVSLSVNNTHTDNSSFLTASVNQLFIDDSFSSSTNTNILQASVANVTDISALTLSTSNLTSENCFCDLMQSTTTKSQTLSAGTQVAGYISSGNLLVEDTLSASSIDTQSMNTTQILTHSVDAHVGRFNDLSVQVLFSNSAFTELNRSQSLSANVCTLHSIESLSVSSSVASFLNSSSEHHLCSNLSVNSSNFVSSHIGRLSVNNVRAVRAVSSLLSAAYTHTDLGVVTGTLSCGGLLVATDLHTSTAHTQILNTEQCVAQLLSTNRFDSDIVKISLLSVSNANLTSSRSSTVSCSALTCDDVRGTRAKFDILSVSSIVGVNLSLSGSSGGVSADLVNELILSVSNSFENALDALSLQDLQGLNTLSCATGKIDTLISDDVHTNTIRSKSLSVSEIAVSSLSVATLHGIVLTQELSVTGLVGHISTASVTTSDLSCGTLFIDNIVRSLPHISDTNNPAVLTTSTVGDFALFSEDTKHSGDMVVEGSLYVTDTIFMGTEPSLNIENVKNMIASSISVGELAVGMLTGIGGGTLGGSITDVVSNLLSVSPHDSIHEGNMQIEGNLVVSGVVLTGAHNKLMSNHGLFEMEGTLSVSGDLIAGDINIVQTLLSLQAQISQLTS